LFLYGASGQSQCQDRKLFLCVLLFATLQEVGYPYAVFCCGFGVNLYAGISVRSSDIQERKESRPCHSSGFLSRRTRFEPKSGHFGFVVDKVALGQVFSEYFGFPCQFSFHLLLQIHHHLSSGTGTIGQLVTDVPIGFSLTSLQESKKK
jgi:hypothetical protein